MVTPSLSGYRFNPVSRTVTLTTTNIGSINFTATAVAPTETSVVASPAALSFTAAGASEQLQVEATYSNETSQNVTSTSTYASNNGSVATVSQGGLVTAVGNGRATIVASYGNLASSVSVTVNIPGVTYSISGSAGIGSATVTLAGASIAATTASGSGTYNFSGLAPGNYTITPSLSGYTFSPPSQSAIITNANVSGVNFTSSQTPHSVGLTWGAGTIQNPLTGQVVVGYDIYRASVSGGPYTRLNSSPVAGLTYIDSAVSAGQTWYYVCSTVDNLGNISGYSNQAAATIP
jgi:inhibitor of cysteine peptidase